MEVSLPRKCELARSLSDAPLMRLFGLFPRRSRRRRPGCATASPAGACRGGQRSTAGRASGDVVDLATLRPTTSPDAPTIEPDCMVFVNIRGGKRSKAAV